MKILITGGAGFIGTNTVKHFSPSCDEVHIIDDLSRKGSEDNLTFLKKNLKNLKFHKGDISDWELIKKVFSKNKFDTVFHLAAQVAVTTSVTEPRGDFNTNALGSFNILEGARITEQDPVMIYSSTNKVYGGMESVRVGKIDKKHYGYLDHPEGIPEDFPLDFHSPYGCSKGCGDQYFIDYSRIYGMRTVVLRQSCIYGDHQHGNEDQGWVAHFSLAVLKNDPITIYGDGMQVRDILYIKDLIYCFEKAIKNINRTKGKAFNIGGGSNNSISLLDLIDILSERYKKKIKVKFDKWRPGDQKVYISNIKKAEKVFSWRPKYDVKTGLNELFKFLEVNR